MGSASLIEYVMRNRPFRLTCAESRLMAILFWASRIFLEISPKRLTPLVRDRV